MKFQIFDKEKERKPMDILSFKENNDLYVIRGYASPCIIPTLTGRRFELNAEDVTVFKNGKEQTNIDAYTFLDKMAVEYLNAAHYMTQSCEELKYLYERMRAEKIDVPSAPREDKYYIGAGGQIMELMLISGSLLAYRLEEGVQTIVDSYTEAVVSDDKDYFVDFVTGVLEDTEKSVSYYHEKGLSAYLSVHDANICCKGLEDFFKDVVSEQEEVMEDWDL